MLLQLTGLSKKQARTTLNFQKTLTQTAGKKKRSVQVRNRRVPPTRRNRSGRADNLDEGDGETTIDDKEDRGLAPEEDKDEDEDEDEEDEDEDDEDDQLSDVYLDSDASSKAEDEDEDEDEG
jgi:hypothetical protein